MTRFQRDALVVSIEEALPVVERMIAAAREREIRNRLVARLAQLDQRLAALRDMSVVGEGGR